jgi:hypothetical protein
MTIVTKQQAKGHGAISVKQFRSGKLEATFISVGDCARFASLLREAQVVYKERFARGGKAITFVWNCTILN